MNATDANKYALPAYEELPKEVAHATALALTYSAGKAIRRLTIDDIGGIKRHAIHGNKTAYADTRVRLLTFGEKCIQHLRDHGHTSSNDLARIYGASASSVGKALGDYVDVRSAVNRMGRTYWITKE